MNYIEIVSSDAEALVGAHEQMHGLSFGGPDADLGGARVATLADGTMLGIRKPLAEHEQPIVRTYVGVSDIEQASKKATASGAMLAYGPTRQGERGTFAILIQGGVQLGLWQR